MKLRSLIAPAALVAATAVGLAPAARAETVGPVTDDKGVVQIPQGQPIFIGGYWVISGPDTALGLDQQRAVEVAIEDRGGELAGHPIRFVVEDSQCNAEGGQTAATKLASNRQIVGVIGAACSSETTPGAPILWNAGMPSISGSATAPALTAADRAEGLKGFLRTIYNDLDNGAFAAKYAREGLNAETAATIHDGSPYAEQLVRVFERVFRESGGEITSAEAVSPTDTDMRPVLTRIATNPPDVIYMPIFVSSAAYMLRQAPEISGLEDTQLVGSDAVLAPTFLEAAGDAAVGFQLIGVDTSPEALGPQYGEFVEKYADLFGEEPIAGFHSQSYDAANMLFDAIEKVAVTEGGTTYIGRQALRDALLETEGMEGLSGTISCNENGDCGDPKFAVWEYTSSDPTAYKPGENPKKVYP
ncbi:MAG TPA: branched-chain amino acid ABC transporter substrate-binding protein, partial [Geminicoccaceae bacterium]|nr:branched-chain amino acid ABC transporter substrate-binding protein [Geminicoccaceae bacterium]